MSTTTITTRLIRPLDEDYKARIASLPLSSNSCPSCGTLVSHPALQALRDAQAKIEDLETQVKILTLRATSAMERATEYETSLRHIASARSPPPQISVSASAPSHLAVLQSEQQQALPPPSSLYASLQKASHAHPSQPERPSSHLGGFPPSRSHSARSLSLNLSPPQPQPSTPSLDGTNYPASIEASLLDALNHEQSLRLAAESFVAQTQGEIEELTAQLFEQANEMVAGERKARARLEERVEVLERRDGEKARRLSTLEERVKRVERVRQLLGAGKDVVMMEEREDMAESDKGTESEKNVDDMEGERDNNGKEDAEIKEDERGEE